MLIERRSLLLGTALLAADAAWAAAPLLVTPRETVGPFYPEAVDDDFADLTRVGGQPKRASGPAIELRGRVLTTAGASVPQAMVLVWQANAAGRYAHSADTSTLPLDPAFRGHALVRTGKDGAFRLLTVMPGAYRAPLPTGMRTPHLHFEVLGANSRLVTQMYFPGQKLNGSDRLIARAKAEGRDPRRMMAEAAVSSEPGVSGYRWDVVLAKG